MSTRINMNLPIDVIYSGTEELGYDGEYHTYYTATLHFMGREIAATPFAAYAKTEASALRMAKAELKKYS